MVFFMRLLKYTLMLPPTNLRECLNSFHKGLFQNLNGQYWSLPNGVMDLLEADDANCCWFHFQRRRFMLFTEWLMGKSNGQGILPSPVLTL